MSLRSWARPCHHRAGQSLRARAYGDVAGLVVGWSNWLAKLAGIAAASVSFAEFLPLVWPAAGQHKIAVATALQLALYGANIAGLREGRAVQETTTIIKPRRFDLHCDRGRHRRAARTATCSSFGADAAMGVDRAGLQAHHRRLCGLAGTAVFLGRNAAPEKSIPKALFYGVSITAALYIAINAALLHALGLHGVAASPLPFMTGSDNLADRCRRFFLP